MPTTEREKKYLSRCWFKKSSVGVFATATRGEALIKAHTHMQSVVPPFHRTESGGLGTELCPQTVQKSWVWFGLSST